MVRQPGDQPPPDGRGAAFREGYVEADGFRIRYMEGGHGTPLVHLHGAGELRLTPGHDLLAGHGRVVAFEMPGFGQSPEGRRTRAVPEIAAIMALAVAALGLDTFNLMGTGLGGTAALWLALQAPERVLALVLEAPAALRPEGAEPPSAALEEVDATARELARRLRGPDGDTNLERRLAALAAPTLVLVGTRDGVTAQAMGRVYKRLISGCHLVFVYDAGHAISADRPEAFAEVVADFLERGDAFVIRRTGTVIHP